MVELQVNKHFEDLLWFLSTGNCSLLTSIMGLKITCHSTTWHGR